MKEKPDQNSAASAHLGVDLAKDKFDAVLRAPAGTLHHEVFPNTPAGCKALGAWLKTHGAVRVTCVMEATGTYAELPAAWLHERGHTVHILNPAAARRFAQSQLARNKTDAVDATLLCRMALIAVACELVVWQPPAAEVLQLRALSRARGSLVEARAALRVQIGECRCALIKKSLQNLQKSHTKEILRLEAALRRHVAAHATLAEDVALLTSIPGIALVSAAAIRSELATLHEASVAETVAYAGLCPRQNQSGAHASGRTPLSKTGNARLRRALYLPALSGGRRNPRLIAFAGRLRAKGKKKMEIVGAHMHKTLAWCCGVLRTRQPFDPHWLAPKPATA
jgi:transposase